MTVIDSETGTNVHEIAAGIYRINMPAPGVTGPNGFTYNQYLIEADAPLLFHTGPRRFFPIVRKAVASVLPVEKLRYISFSHVESDECGSLNEWLAVAPQAEPLCGRTAARVSIYDMADRPPRALADGETLSLGSHEVQWWDTPHLPHGWDCGCIAERTSATLFCGDLFTQDGTLHKPLVETDILEPSENFRKRLDYYAHCPDSAELLEKLAATSPKVLACMHGSAWTGDGAALLRRLATALTS